MKRLIFRLLLSAVTLSAVVWGSSCTNNHRHFEKAQETKTATEVVNHGVKPIIIETLHDNYLGSGIYKITIDSANSFVVVSNNDALAIERLK